MLQSTRVTRVDMTPATEHQLGGYLMKIKNVWMKRITAFEMGEQSILIQLPLPIFSTLCRLVSKPQEEHTRELSVSQNMNHDCSLTETSLF